MCRHRKSEVVTHLVEVGETDAAAEQLLRDRVVGVAHATDAHACPTRHPSGRPGPRCCRRRRCRASCRAAVGRPASAWASGPRGADDPRASRCRASESSSAKVNSATGGADMPGTSRPAAPGHVLGRGRCCRAPAPATHEQLEVGRSGQHVGGEHHAAAQDDGVPVGDRLPAPIRCGCVGLATSYDAVERPRRCRGSMGLASRIFTRSSPSRWTRCRDDIGVPLHRSVGRHRRPRTRVDQRASSRYCCRRCSSHATVASGLRARRTSAGASRQITRSGLG